MEADPHIYEFGDFQLDMGDRVLIRNGNPVFMAPKLIDTLIVLVEHRGELVTKHDLMELLWPDTHVEEANLTQNIFMLRKILGEKNGAKFIETVPRRGYRFACELRPVSMKAGASTLREETRTRVVVTSSSSGISTGVLMAIGGSVLAAIVLIVGVSFLWPRLNRTTGEKVAASPPGAAAIILKRLTYQSSVHHAAISPDGKYLAYDLMADTASGPKQSLQLQNIDTGSVIEVMPPAMPGYGSLNFSPDGNHLYFGSLLKGAKTGSITRVPIFGGTSQHIVHNVWSAFSLSPDGEQVTFIRSFPTQASTNTLLIANTKDGKETEVATEHWNREKWMNIWGCAPVFSPDGQKIAVTGGVKDYQGVRGALFEVTIAGGAVNEITTPRWAAIQHVVWLVDGKGLVVAAQEKDADPFQLWLVNYPSGEARRLTNDLSDYGRVTVTADGKSVAAQQTTRVSHVWLLPFGSVSDARQLTSGMVSDGHSGLNFSPDGRIVFASNRNGAHDMWSMDTNGGDGRQLTAKTGGRNNAPVHTPDGRYIVFASNRSGASHVWRADSDGNNSVQLTSVAASAPAVSPDSRWVYYTNWSDSPTVIEKVSIEGGQPIRVTNGKYGAGSASVSPDGKLLAHTFYDEENGMQVAVMSSDGGDPINLFGHAAQHIFRWTPDSRALIFIKPVTGNMPGANLWLQPIGGGAPAQLTKFGPTEDPLTNFAVSADGKQIAIARGRLYSDIVLISNFR
jgi:Tol biopolymer transport system component/DNA-binding winged helix-turn-helix (wHTH) protein